MIRLKLREEQFDAMTTLLGLRTDVARAQYIGISPRHLCRARKGKVGHDFAARAVYALTQNAAELSRYGLTPSLDSLFDVVAA